MLASDVNKTSAIMCSQRDKVTLKVTAYIKITSKNNIQLIYVSFTCTIMLRICLLTHCYAVKSMYCNST